MVFVRGSDSVKDARLQQGVLGGNGEGAAEEKGLGDISVDLRFIAERFSGDREACSARRRGIAGVLLQQGEGLPVGVEHASVALDHERRKALAGLGKFGNAQAAVLELKHGEEGVVGIARVDDAFLEFSVHANEGAASQGEQGRNDVSAPVEQVTAAEAPLGLPVFAAAEVANLSPNHENVPNAAVSDELAGLANFVGPVDRNPGEKVGAAAALGFDQGLSFGLVKNPGFGDKGAHARCKEVAGYSAMGVRAGDNAGEVELRHCRHQAGMVAEGGAAVLRFRVGAAFGREVAHGDDLELRVGRYAVGMREFAADPVADDRSF